MVARGAFGKVLKVRKKDTGTTYVMKVLSKSRIILENAVQQCKDEVLIQVSRQREKICNSLSGDFLSSPVWMG